MPARRDNYLAPRYLISVEGTKLKEDVTQFVSKVSWSEAEKVAAKLTLVVSNPDFRFLEARTFQEGNEIDLWMGYVGRPVSYMGRGVVVKPNPGFPRSGVPKFTVIAHDASHRLMHAGVKDRGKTYAKLSDSDIAEKIFREEKIAPFTLRTRGLKTRTRKKGVTRWQFLQRLARINGYVVNVRFDVVSGLWNGFFGPPDMERQEEQFTFSYGTGEADATLLEFWPDYSTPSQTTRIEVVYTDPKTKKTHRLEVKVDRKSEERTKFTGAIGVAKMDREVRSGPSVQLTVFGQREEVVADRQFASTADAKRWAANWWFQRQREFVFANGVLVGEPSLRKGQVHRFTGLGPRLSGRWQLTGVDSEQPGSELGFESKFSAVKVALETVVSAPGNVAKVKDKESQL